jgi:hypothetical protein
MRISLRPLTHSAKRTRSKPPRLHATSRNMLGPTWSFFRVFTCLLLIGLNAVVLHDMWSQYTQSKASHHPQYCMYDRWDSVTPKNANIVCSVCGLGSSDRCTCGKTGSANDLRREHSLWAEWFIGPPGTPFHKTTNSRRCPPRT